MKQLWTVSPSVVASQLHFHSIQYFSFGVFIFLPRVPLLQWLFLHDLTRPLLNTLSFLPLLRRSHILLGLKQHIRCAIDATVGRRFILTDRSVVSSYPGSKQFPIAVGTLHMHDDQYYCYHHCRQYCPRCRNLPWVGTPDDGWSVPQPKSVDQEHCSI